MKPATLAVQEMQLGVLFAILSHVSTAWPIFSVLAYFAGACFAIGGAIRYMKE